LESPSTIYLPFYDVIGDGSDPGVNTTEVFVELLKSCKDLSWDVLLLKGVPEGSRIARELNTSTTSYLSRPAAHCDYLSCLPFEEYKLVLSKNFRGNLRKARNKLNGRNGVQYVCCRDKNEIKGALSRFVALEAIGWKGQIGGAIAQRPEMKRYYESLVEIFGSEPRGGCEINELWAEGVLAASQVCVRFDQTLYVLKVTYREELANLAPGNLLLAWLIDRCALTDELRYVNLVSDTDWHSDWKPSKIVRWDFELYRSPIRRTTIRLVRRGKSIVKSSI
jgi:CelD/BcsL family acetyltransferase involved in cellulose biosynthesis